MREPDLRGTSVMKHSRYVFFGTLIFCAPVFGQSITLDNVARTNEIIEFAYEAHGGEAGLDNLETVIIEQSQTGYSNEQSRGTEPPWDRTYETGYNAINLTNRTFARRLEGEGGAFEFDTGTIINGSNSAQINYRAGTAATLAEPDFDAASAALTRVTPALLVKNLKRRASNAWFLGETSIEGVDYEVVGFSMTTGPAITLYFDKQDHMLRRSERVFAGAGMVEYEFLDYENIDGIPFNRAIRLYLDGDPNFEREIQTVKVNKSIDKYLEVDSRLERVAAQVPDELSRREITDGVWLIGGNGTYAMFVDMGEYIFAAGGTAGIADRIRLLREVAGDKPVRYGMLTHHHYDHVMGVADYEKEGATIVAAEAHVGVARRAAKNGDELNVLEITGEYTLTGSGRTVRILDIGPTAHTNHLLVAYLPEEKILFEGDHFAMPLTGPMPPAVTSTRSFAEALANQDIEVKKFLSAHSPRVGTPEDLQLSLEKELFQAGH